MFIEISYNLRKLSKFFPENLYIVGGYVRNKLLNINSGDVDLASSVDIEEVANRLKDSGYTVKIKNLKLGSLLISKDAESYEYTTFRKETYLDDGSHCPVKVEFTKDITEDAKRRDFTINAIYYNINKDEVIDLHHGIVDLSQKIIRCVIDPSKVLKNDGERILRMVRIAGELNFKIDKKTLKYARLFTQNLENIKGTRKLLEIEKILYCDKRYGLNKSGLKRALKMLNYLGIWKHFGLSYKRIKYNMVLKTEDRFLGLLIDFVDMVKPDDLQTFLENFLKEQFGLGPVEIKKIYGYLAGYYDALKGMHNKEFFLNYYGDWAYIYSLLGEKSKRTQTKYNFFYQYIIKHRLVISVSDLAIGENDIKKKFPKIDKEKYEIVLKSLLSKVFDGELKNEKAVLLKEIAVNEENY